MPFLVVLQVQNEEIPLTLKKKASKTANEGDPTQWQASVRPVICAPEQVDSSFWCQLYLAAVAGAPATLELTYAAGVPGSTFKPIGVRKRPVHSQRLIERFSERFFAAVTQVQAFDVKLQPYDPMVSGRTDLLSHFVLPKHPLVAAATNILIASWGPADVELKESLRERATETAKETATETVELGVLRSTLATLSEQCFAVQEQFVQCAAAAASTPDGTPLAEVKKRSCHRLFLRHQYHLLKHGRF